ncbi:MAG TPA: hypothetical protein DGG94_07830, partial [Micromonosporaceae bacterium]|nr:hypothetical protein [Micromonosporaceae bacterium]
MLRRVLAAGRSIVELHRGWSGLVAGVAAGVVGTVLLSSLMAPLWLDPEGLEKGTIVVLSGRDDGLGGQRQALIDQWNALPGRPRAEIIELTGGADAYRSEMVSRAQAGGGGIDVFNLDVTWIAEFAHAGYLRPLAREGLDTSGFLAKPLETCWYQDKLWALPFNTDAGLLFYRSDLITSSPPSSWPAIRNTIDDVFARQGSQHPELIAGYTGQLADYEGLTVNAFEAIWAAEGDVVKGNGDVVIDTAEAREGLRRLATGLQPGNPQHILPESLTYEESRSMQAFRDGKTLFMRNWPVAYRHLGVPGESAGDVLAFQTTVLPRGSVLGGQNLAISKSSDQPRAAQKLIEFLTGERSQQILFERGGFAATRELVYQDSEVQQRYPYAQTLLTAVRTARLRPVT